MHVRDVAPGDAPVVHDLTAASMRAAYEPLVEDETLIEAFESPGFEDDLRDWYRLLPRNGVVYQVAERGERVVGFCQLLWGDAARESYVGDRDALLHSLYVHPDHWGNGVGTVLWEATRSGVPADCDRVVLSVLPNNERAKEFYRRRGFGIVGESEYAVGNATYGVDLMAREQ